MVALTNDDARPLLGAGVVVVGQMRAQAQLCRDGA